MEVYIYYLGMIGGFALGVAFVIISQDLRKRSREEEE